MAIGAIVKAIGTAAKGAAKKAGQAAVNKGKSMANNIFKKKDNGSELQEKLKKRMILWVVFTFGPGIIFIACIGLIIQGIFGSSSNSIKITTGKYEEQLKNGTFTGDKKQIERALSLSSIYGTNIWFTPGQIDEIFNQLKESFKDEQQYLETYSSHYGDITNDIKENFEKRYKSLFDESGNLKQNLNSSAQNILNYYKYTKNGKFRDIVTPYDNLPIYVHCLNSEKYNFNSIKWMAYTHSEDAKELEADDFTSNSELGLIYPKSGGYTLDQFVDVLSPYLMSSYIPLAHIASAVFDYNNSSSVGNSWADEYYREQEGKYNDVSDFAYQIVKYGQSDITMNQYNLENQTITSHYRDYDIYDCKDSFTIHVTVTYEKKEKKNIFGITERDENGQIKYEKGNPTTTYTYGGNYVDGTTQLSDSNKKGHNNTRWEPGTQNEKETCEEDINRSYGLNIQYKLDSAIAFDVNIKNMFDYERYNDDDANNLVNPTATLRDETSDYTEVMDENAHYTLEEVQNLSESELASLAANGQQGTPSSSNEGYTVTYDVVYTSGSYEYNKGIRRDFTRYYSDSVSAEPTSTTKKLLGEQDINNFNANTEQDPFKSTVSAEEFRKDTDSVNYYNDNLIGQEGTALNKIHILNSNPKIYLNYISSSQAYSTYVGYDVQDYPLSQGTSQLKIYFNQLANDNDGVLPFVYGATWGFDVNASPASSIGGSGGATGMSLLKEYIRSFEGAGEKPVSKNDEGVDCYTAYRDTAGKLTVGYGVNLDAHPDQRKKLQELTGYPIEDGTKVPVEYVDAVEEDFIMIFYNMAKSAANGLDLKEYQLHALASLAYNTGGGGIVDKIASLYNDHNYWNEETDDRFEEVSEKYKDTPENVSAIQSEANLDLGMYKNYFAKYCHDVAGNELEGLVRRRKSEFIVFSLGYYDTLKKFYMQGGGGNLAGIELLNSDGSVNEAAVLELQNWYESNVFVGGPSAPLNVSGGSIYKGVDGNASGYGLSNINPEYQQYFKYVTSGGPIRASYFQCTWWAESMAYAFLSTNSNGKFGNVMGTASLGNGGDVATNLASQYGVNLYTNINDMQQGFHYVLSLPSSSQYGHVVYVEAVGSNDIVISHCGSGITWYGLAIAPKTDSKLVNNRGFVCLEEILEQYK